MNQSTTKSIAKNFSWLALGDLLSRVVNLSTNIYIARILGAASFGLINFAQAFMTYLVLFVDSGFSLLGTKEIAKSKNKMRSIAINLFSLRLLIALIVFALSVLILVLLPLPMQYRLLFIGTFLFVFYRALNADWAFQGMEKMEWIALTKLCFSMLSIILVIALVKTGTDMLKVPFLIAFSGIATSIVFLFVLAKVANIPRIDGFSPSDWRYYFLESIPLGLSALLSQIYSNIDTIMLGFMHKPEIVGYYNAAFKFFFFFVSFYGLWQSTAYPVIVKRINENVAAAERFLNKYLRLSMFIMAPAVCLIAILSPYIIKLFFGLDYSAASPALQILIWGTLMNAISGMYGILVLIPSGRSRQFMYAVGVGACINIALNFILIPPFGHIGAAFSTVLTESAAALLMYYFSSKVLNIGFSKALAVPLLIAFAATSVFLLPLPISSPLLKHVLLSLVFISLYLAIFLLLGGKKFIADFLSEIFSFNQSTGK